MKSLKSRFGKFAVSSEEMAKVKGGNGDGPQEPEEVFQCFGTDSRYPGQVFQIGSPTRNPVAVCSGDSRCIGCFPAAVV